MHQKRSRFAVLYRDLFMILRSIIILTDPLYHRAVLQQSKKLF